VNLALALRVRILNSFAKWALTDNGFAGIPLKITSFLAVQIAQHIELSTPGRRLNVIGFLSD
jgi:hypothetical protein